MKEFLVGVVVGVLITLLGVALYVNNQDRNACEAKGGVYLREGCVKLERIK